MRPGECLHFPSFVSLVYLEGTPTSRRMTLHQTYSVSRGMPSQHYKGRTYCVKDELFNSHSGRDRGIRGLEQGVNNLQ